ncbi:MAG: M14 family zinc carboxypeptidase [Mariprofundaceae bacterium]
MIALCCVWVTPVQAESSATTAVFDECQRIGHKLGSVSIKTCLNSQLLDTGARSVQGQALLIKEYPPIGEREPLARVLLIGGTHGDEYSSVSLIFKWMNTLDLHHSGLFHWHVVPLLNPDGLLKRHSERLNGHGVDLNRNMPTPNWQDKTTRYWKKTAYDPRRYPGTAALSEPESKWLYSEIRSFKPHVIISVHAPYGVLDFDGPPVGPQTLGKLHLKSIGVYPGSLGNSAGIQHHIPVVTVELPYAGIMPSQQQISKMWTDLIVWLRYNIPKQETLNAYPTFDQVTRKLLPDPIVKPLQGAVPRLSLETDIAPVSVN